MITVVYEEVEYTFDTRGQAVAFIQRIFEKNQIPWALVQRKESDEGKEYFSMRSDLRVIYKDT